MKPFEEPVYITRPFLPPLDEFIHGLKEIWKSKWLTNDGPFVKKFRNQLSEYLGLDNVSVFTNGTLALQIGIQALEISGEVITTPFTFVATTHALFWNRLRPVFCDIESEFFNLDPEKVEKLITPNTAAILAVHVFGNPCQVDKLESLADKYNIKLIYDAAHAFGVKIKNRSINEYGNLIMNSFHATKPMHTFEGGMLSCDAKYSERIEKLKNFGFEGEERMSLPGTNAKMTEVQALMGLLMLKYIDEIIEKRKAIYALYKDALYSVPGIILCPEMPDVRQNYSYVPVRVIESDFGMSRDELHLELMKYNIHTRKYFSTLVCDFQCYSDWSNVNLLNVAKEISLSVLTLPIYPDLEIDDVHKIIDIIISLRR